MQRKEEKLERVEGYVENCEQAQANYIENNPETFEKLITWRDKCGFFKKFLDVSKKVDDRTQNIESVSMTRGSRRSMISYIRNCPKKTISRLFTRISRNGAK